MRRREFMALIGGTVAWPLRARAAGSDARGRGLAAKSKKRRDVC